MCIARAYNLLERPMIFCHPGITRKAKMKTRFFGVLAMLCVLLAVSASRAEGDDTGKKSRNYGSIIDLHYIYFILSHVQDLSLTNDQETKLKALRADMEKEIDAMLEDPDYQALQKKMQDARKAKNTDEANNVLQQIKDLRAKKAPTATQAGKLITSTLTKEQNSKLSELLRAQREKGQTGAETKPADPAQTQPAAGK